MRELEIDGNVDPQRFGRPSRPAFPNGLERPWIGKVTMTTPLEITFKGLDKSDAIETKVAERVAKLEKHFDRMTYARVVVAAPHKHAHKGKSYEIKIEIGIPGSSRSSLRMIPPWGTPTKTSRSPFATPSTQPSAGSMTSPTGEVEPHASSVAGAGRSRRP